MNTEEEGRWTAVAAEAQRLVQAGRCEEAEAAVRSIPVADAGTRHLHAKVSAFVALGTALIQAGQREKGAGVLAEAEALTRALRTGGNWEEAYALFDIGQAWRDAGDNAEALRLWDASVEVVEGKDTSRLLAALYRESRTMGLWDRAQRVLGLLPRRYPAAKDQVPK
jgi:tetratricopeptide (TPR) repeat protein